MTEKQDVLYELNLVQVAIANVLNHLAQIDEHYISTDYLFRTARRLQRWTTEAQDIVRQIPSREGE